MARIVPSIPDMISKKRDGLELSVAEIEKFVTSLTSGAVEDCQVGAMLMAMYLNNLNKNEVTCLTRAMMNSGETLRWPEEWAKIVVDKHSTGGVGDKVSLILAPALASLGLKVPMISGRGLAHTGGTLDKLESIPGFKVSVTTEKMLDILGTVGCCIVGQTNSLCPADRVLYRTRDVTGTVNHLGLITASIISKKAAENLCALVLDVKFGSGAVMQDKAKARELAQVMVQASNGLGIKTSALLTDMNAPIGYMIGNALEVIESIQCLCDRGPEDLTSLVASLGGQVLASAGKAKSAEDGYNMIRETIRDGSALAKFCAMMKSQGVAPETADLLCQSDGKIKSILPRAPYTTDVKCTSTGYVTELNAMACAVVVHKLGGGRTKAGGSIDFAVGLELLVSIGQKINEGSPWVKVHHSEEITTETINSLQTALVVQPDKPNITGNRIAEVIR